MERVRLHYVKSDWYWFVAGDTSQVWSSKAAGYVPLRNADYVAWLAQDNKPTIINVFNDMLEIQIQVLQESVNQGHLIEHTLGTDNGYLAGVQDKIVALRAQMT